MLTAPLGRKATETRAFIEILGIQDILPARGICLYRFWQKDRGRTLAAACKTKSHKPDRKFNMRSLLTRSKWPRNGRHTASFWSHGPSRIQVGEGDASIAHSLDQVLPQRCGELGPLFNFG